MAHRRQRQPQRLAEQGNRSVWQNKAAHWTAQGYAFASVNTRLIPDATPVDQAWDLARAMALVQQMAARRGIGTDQIMLVGHSAGAHVAALLAVRQDMQNAAGLQPWQGTIMLDSAAFDVPTIMQATPARLYRQAFGTDPAQWIANSPQAHLDRRDGPFLIVCSNQRRDACPAAQRFARQASGHGIATTLLPVQLGHAEINRRLGQANAYTQAVDNWVAALD